MSKKKKKVLLTASELKAKIKSLEYDFESISAMPSPNPALIKSIREKMYHLTEQLKKAELWEKRKHERQVAHQHDRKDTIARKHEQVEKEEIRTESEWKPPKAKFGSTLRLSDPS